MHWWPSNHTGAERDSAFDGGVAGWEQLFTHTSQTTGDWRAALRATRTWRVGSGHTLPTAKAAWFGGGLAGVQDPTLPLFSYLLGLISPSDIFEVKYWSDASLLPHVQLGIEPGRICFSRAYRRSRDCAQLKCSEEQVLDSI